MEEDWDARQIAYNAFNKATIWRQSFLDYMSFKREGISYLIGNPPFNISFSRYYDHPLSTDSDEEDGGKGHLLSQNHFIKCCEYYLEAG